jgi:ribose transport system substrate-binding protein
MKHLLVTAVPVAALFLAAVAGCTRRGDLTVDFAVLYQTVNNPFFKDLNRGLEKVVQEHGHQLDVFDSNFDAKIQKQQMSDILQAGYRGIFLNPVDWKGIERSLQEAKKAGVPVIVIDAPVEDRNLVLTTVASDNFMAGKLAGEALKKARPDGAKLALLTYPPNKACRDRVAGFKAALGDDEKYQTDVEQPLRSGTREAAFPIMKDILQRSPDLTAVFAINDPSAFGVLRALDQAGMTERVVVLAVDGNAAAIEEIARGRMLGSSAQFPEQIGIEAARALYDHLEEKEVPQEIKIPVELIERSNVERFRKLAERS